MAAPNCTLPGGYSGDPKNPLSIGAAVVPHDANDLPWLPRAIHVGTAGNVKMNVSDGSVAGVTTLTTFLELGWHPIQPVRIWAAGTAAADITMWR